MTQEGIRKMKQRLDQMAADINSKLEDYLPEVEGRLAHIYDAMRYSVLAGGKRIRPILLLLAYDAVGGKGEDIYPFACAMEMIHTYSLIHDDLPAMDNDDYRRGMPTNHIKYGEWTAILAGDALLNQAFEVMLEASTNNPKPSYIEAMHILSVASGTRGMIGGQVVDIISENKAADRETVDFIHQHKTAALMVAPVDMGATLGGASQEEKQALHNYAFNLGLAFQIQDDILDVLSTQEELGKPIDSDAKNNKATYVSMYGIEQAKNKVAKLTSEAIEELDLLGERGNELRALAKYLTSRTY